MRRVFFSFLILFCVAALDAQERWSLEKCIKYGVDNNIAIQQYALAQDNQEIDLQSAKLSRLPGISASIGENGNIGRAQNREGIYEDHTAVTTSVNLNASMSLFQGGRINNQIKYGEFSYEAATADLQQAREDISLQIVNYYLQALYCKEIYKVAQEQIVLNKELIERTRLLVDAGKSSESELFEAQASLAKQKSAEIDALNNLQSALLDLAQAMNLQDVDGFDIEELDTQLIVDEQVLRFPSTDEVYQEYVNNKPSIKAAELRIQAGKSNVAIAKSSYYPSLTIGASYGTSYYYTKDLAEGFSASALKNQFSQNGATIVGLNLQIPIFNRMSTRNDVRRAKLDLENQQLKLEQEKISLLKDVQQARHNAEAALYKYISAEESVNACELAYEYESVKYESGRSNAYQFNEVRQRLFSARSEMTQAKYNFILRSKILDFYEGEPLY